MSTSTNKKSPVLLRNNNNKKNSQPVLESIEGPKLVTSKMKIRPEYLAKISPLTDTQRTLFDVFQNSNSHLVLDGFSGCGKSFVSIYLALKEVLIRQQYKKIIIIRSAVPSRDVGFLPGTLEEKIAFYEAPYKDIVSELFVRDMPEPYKKLQEQKLIEFMPTSFLRGTTINNAIIIVDEYQNMSWNEIYTVMTRVGYNSKIVWCGDLRQNDLTKSKYDRTGADKLLKVVDKMPEFVKITFKIDDIVRSELVKSWIVSCDSLGFDSNTI